MDTIIAPLMRDGVPGLAVRTSGAHYFDWHHSRADTADKVKPEDLRANYDPQNDVVGSGFNVSSYNNPKVNDLMNQAKTLPGCDQAKRAALYGQVQQILERRGLAYCGSGPDACALAMVHLSRLAEDLIIFCGDEHRFFELADAQSTGSSMMPQKKNPDPLELVRGKAGRSLGHLVALLTTLKGLPSGYNKDLQEDKQAVFDAEDTLFASLAAVRSVIGGLTLNRPRAESAASGLLLATDVADYLVGRGVPFRRAHEIVGALVRKLIAEGRDFGSLALPEWRAASDRFEGDILGRVTPRVSVAAKCTPQSTAPAAVAAALADVQQWLARMSGR
jgi:hypothetical protein